MSDNAISVKNVSKSFKLPHEKHTGLKQAVINFRPGKKYEMQRVLEDITFDIKKGEFFGIVGRNGSGKSTLLKLLAQIYTPDRGAIHVNGSLTPFIELGVGFNPELTGRENIYLNGALLGFDRKQMDGMYDDIVSFAEIERFIDQRLKNYSSGMQVRLAFSIAIRAKSDILLLDEVLAVGDTAFQQKCFDYFEKLKRDGTTVILVTHDMEAVKRFCGKAAYIEKGKIIEISSPAEIADIYIERNLSKHEPAGKATTETVETESSITVETISQDSKKLNFKINYSTKQSFDVYVGFSVIRDGLSVAELNTSMIKNTTGNGEIAYSLKLSEFNAGTYEIGAVLFKKDNRELIAVTDKKERFIIKGHDLARGGAIKLPDSWS